MQGCEVTDPIVGAERCGPDFLGHIHRNAFPQDGEINGLAVLVGQPPNLGLGLRDQAQSRRDGMGQA